MAKRGARIKNINPAFNKQGLSRAIPTEIKLQVRKRCGFGCVICGLGIYEYEHFDPEFKHATSHNPDGITLLCPNHHTRKTKGLLSKESVIRRNNNPEALKQGFISDELDLSAEDLIMFMGTNSFKKTAIAVQIGDEPILSITPSDEEDEPYHLSAKLRDRQGSVILEIEKNEWKTHIGSWDCKTIGNRIQIRSAPREIELIIKHIPPNELHIERLRMVHKGYIIEAHESNPTKFITPDGSVITLNNYEMENWNVGIHLHPNGDVTLGVMAGEGGGIIGHGSFSDHSTLERYHISDPR